MECCSTTRDDFRADFDSPNSFDGAIGFPCRGHYVLLNWCRRRCDSRIFAIVSGECFLPRRYFAILALVESLRCLPKR